MRFITEFELIQPVTRSFIDAHKAGQEEALGTIIAETFDWQEKRKGDKSGFSLEIEAFPMDKWVEFKHLLFQYLETKTPLITEIKIREMLKELESFGKPAGEAKELH